MANKYRAKPTTVDGIRFDSGVEARRYGELKLLELAGKITKLECHPRFTLRPGFRTRRGKKIRPITYKADFRYAEDGQIVVEDVKGGKATQTEAFRIKWKMLQAEFPLVDARIVEM